jgi:hypothetical protein
MTGPTIHAVLNAEGILSGDLPGECHAAISLASPA